MTTKLPPQLVRETGLLTVEKVQITPLTGVATAFDLKTNKATGVISTTNHIGHDDGANFTTYGKVTVEILDPTNGSEDGCYVISTMQSGTLTDAVNVCEGLYMEGATGGDQGAGTINATQIYVQGVAVGTGVGDVVGPASATDHAVARYDLTTGKLIQNSLVIIDDSGNVTGVNDLTVTGNLDVNGTLTTVDTTTLAVSDPLIQLARGNNTTDVIDIGFVGLYDTSGSQDLYAGLFRDATDGKFRLFNGSQEDLSVANVVNTGATGYTKGVLVADLEGTATGNVANTLFDANTIIKADVDDTPVALTVAASTFVGRKATGGISDMSAAEALTVLGVTAGAEPNLDWSRSTVTAFTPDVTTALTLPANPAGDKAKVRVYYDGLAQHQGEWSLSGTTITFTAAIPTGVVEVELLVLA